MKYRAVSPVLQLIAGVVFLVVGIKEFEKWGGAWSIGLIAIGVVLLIVGGVLLTIRCARKTAILPE